jgi:predicted DNA-binding protein (MmcQ/YjbR family)
MFTVEYGYYNYPKKTKKFKTYENAKKFFYYIGKRNGVKRVNLKVGDV